MVLRASDALLAKNMAIIRRNRALLAAFVARHAALFEWVPPTAGAIAFLRFKGPLSSQELGAQLAEAGIGFKPAYCFTDFVTPETDYFRVGYGEEVFPEALAALEATRHVGQPGDAELWIAEALLQLEEPERAMREAHKARHLLVEAYGA